jgi:hypothetical protein
VPVAKSAVTAVAEVELTAHRSPGYQRRFTAGVMYGAGELTWPLLCTFHEARPDVELNVVHVGFYDASPSSSCRVHGAVGPHRRGASGADFGLGRRRRQGTGRHRDRPGTQVRRRRGPWIGGC